MGSLSKAARGYQLAQGNPPRQIQPFPLLKAGAKATVEQGMVAAMSAGLHHWQYHEEVWLRGNAAAQDAVREALDLLRQAFSLFGALVPRKASSALRQQLTTLEETLVNEEQDAATFCLSSLSVETQLALTHWLAESQWRQWIDAKGEAKLQGSYKRFSDIMLSRVNADLRETFITVKQPNEYQDKATRLARQLLTVHLLAGFYPSEAVVSWLDPWQQLLSAIHEKQTSGLAWLAMQALKQPPFWLTSGAGR
jgi:triphosphatase